MATKLYPFSLQKHGHDIEFYHNRLFNTKCAMESGEIPMDAKRYDAIVDMLDGDLRELREEGLYNSRDGRICWLTGKQLNLAKRITFWASEERASHCKPAYRQYC